MGTLRRLGFRDETSVGLGRDDAVQRDAEHPDALAKITVADALDYDIDLFLETVRLTSVAAATDTSPDRVDRLRHLRVAARR